MKEITMKVRDTVLLKMTGVGLATVGVILGLTYLFGDWGIIIFWSGVLVYLLRILYLMQVDTAIRKQQDIIDRLKK
jgi:hypothetical protein